MDSKKFDPQQLDTQTFGGYSKEQVHQLLELAQTSIEQLQQENQNLTYRIQYLEGQLALYEQRALNNTLQSSLSAANQLVASIKKLIGRDFMALIKQQSFDHIAEFFAQQDDDWYIVALQLVPQALRNQLIHGLPDERRVAILTGIASLRTIPQPKIDAVLSETKDHFLPKVEQPETSINGIQTTIDLIYALSPAEQQESLSQLATKKPELHQQLTKKMFFYNQIKHLDKYGIQTLLKQLDRGELVLAMCDKSQSAINKLFLSNISKRASEDLREEIDIMGKPSRSQISTAQNSIARTTCQLIADGLITYEP